MEIQLILGPNNSGKSLHAEKLVVESQNSNRIYLATMISQTEENKYRIQKHIEQRSGKGFQTIEEPWNIHTLDISSDSIFLLEDASNLLANGIFARQKNVLDAYEKIVTLANHCQKLIIVSITGLTPGPYDEETNHYIKQLNALNEMLLEIAKNHIQF